MVDCIVEYDYEAEQPDELSIKVGQTIKNVVTEDGGWWEGELDGKKGMFPDNFVKIIEKPQKEKPVERREDIKKDQLKTQQRTSVRDLASKMKDGIPFGGSQKKKDTHQAVIKRAKVLYSYDPDNEDELKLEVDDVVDVFKQEEEGWWEGSLNGKVGVFPSNFVEVIEDIDALTKSTEEKPKEAPPTEPKSKKIVGGVGLGNIFDGGPIKLRSTPGAKKQSEVEPKSDELASHAPASHTPGSHASASHAPASHTPASHAPASHAQASHTPASHAPASHTPASHAPASHTPAGHAPASHMAGNHVQIPTAKKEKQERAIVRHSYDADNEDELALKIGDIVNIISKEEEDPGWWKGELNGKVGVFPDNFVEMMQDEFGTDKRPPSKFLPKTEPQPRPKKPPPPSTAPAAQATPKLPEKTTTAEPPLSERNIKKKDDLPSVEKTAPPALPSKKPSVPPPLLRKPAKPEPPRPTSQTEHKLPPPTTKEEPVTEEKKPTGHFDEIQSSTDKLTHLTASRPKGPAKRPPSQVFNHMSQEVAKTVKNLPSKEEIEEEERNGDVKDNHWIKDDKTVLTKSHTKDSKEEVHRGGGVHNLPPTRPPEPSTATIPSSAITSLHSAIEDLKKEIQHLKSTTVSKSAFDELKQENEKLRHDVDLLKVSCNRKLRDLVNEVDEEKKIRLGTQVEIERIKKLVNESHV